MPNIQLSNNLRYLRRQRGQKQAQISEMLNISRQAYSNYETGRRTPDLDTLLVISDFYKVSLNDLVLTNLRDRTSQSRSFGEDPVPYTITRNKQSGSILYLTDEEIDMVTRFRRLSDENRRILAGFLTANSNISD